MSSEDHTHEHDPRPDARLIVQDLNDLSHVTITDMKDDFQIVTTGSVTHDPPVFRRNGTVQVTIRGYKKKDGE